MTRNKILRFHENVTPRKLRINDACIFHNSHFAITVLSHIHLFSKLITLMKNDSWNNDLSRERLFSLFFSLYYDKLSDCA